MRLVVAPGVGVDLESALGNVAQSLEAGPYAGVHPEVTAFVGRVDPLVVARAPGPIVGVPLGGDASDSSPQLARATALAVLDRTDLLVSSSLPVVDVGMPAPARSASTLPLDPGPGAAALARALSAELDVDPSDEGPGVTWIRGRGAVPRARAMAAWRSGRAVVALPGTDVGPLLERARCQACETSMAALELTRLLLVAPPLVRVLVSRGRRALEQVPSVDAVCQRFLEAAELAASTPRPRDRSEAWREGRQSS